MAKFQLTIATSYVSDWGLWQGVREMVQNGLDGQDDGHHLKVSHHGDTLRISNTGAKLDAKVWLLGNTSKSNGNYRGHHGEGLKLGTLALLRAGLGVKIINDDESWTPTLEESDVFGDEKVLTISTHKRQQATGMFSVEISGISKETWNELKWKFLFLSRPKKSVRTSKATVLLDEDMRGKIFVKGIYVQTSADLQAGYDFDDVSIDRDRRMVSSWDTKYAMAAAWEEAMTKDPTMRKRVMTMMMFGANDVAGIANTNSAEVQATLVKDFLDEHGLGAIPVSSMSQAREVEHFARRGVVVPLALLSVLSQAQDLNVDHVRVAFMNTTQARYSWKDLKDSECAVYLNAVNLVQNAAKDLGYEDVESRLQIVDFRDDKLDGKYADGQVQVARRLLSDPEEFLSTLVHEVAHSKGGDGSVSHERAEGKLYARIISNLSKT